MPRSTFNSSRTGSSGVVNSDAFLSEILNSADFRKLEIEMLKKGIKQSGNELVSEEQLQLLGWAHTSPEEYIVLNTTLADNHITSRESVIMFLATCAAETGYGQHSTEQGNDAYFILKKYSKDERGVGYIQLTLRDSHLSFIHAMGGDYEGAKTADYIDVTYNPWVVSAYVWSTQKFGERRMNEYAVENGLSFETFLAIQYFVNGYLEKKDFPDFDGDLHGIVNDGFDYGIDYTNEKLLVNGRSYRLPKGWAAREEAYNRAISIF